MLARCEQTAKLNCLLGPVLGARLLYRNTSEYKFIAYRVRIHYSSAIYGKCIQGVHKQGTLHAPDQNWLMLAEAINNTGCGVICMVCIAMRLCWCALKAYSDTHHVLMCLWRLMVTHIMCWCALEANGDTCHVTLWSCTYIILGAKHRMM